MEHTVWAYPWDLGDIGLDASLADMRGRAGAGMVGLATSYHAGRFVQPASPARKTYFPEDGVVYYRPDPALWNGAEIQPRPAREVAERGDMLEALIRRREAGGPRVACWTVCLHNTRLGTAHPAHVARDAFGDPVYYSLCPSSPAARAYVATMVRDITTRYRPDRIELETPSFMGLVHGYHHEKDGVGLPAEDELLLSLCFCEHCKARAAAAGVDGEAAQRAVRELIAETCARAVPEPRFERFPAEGIDAFATRPELHAWLAWRSEPVTSLIAECRAAADPATRVVVLQDAAAWHMGLDLAAAGAACDGALVCAYDMTVAETEALVRAARAVLGPDRFVGAALRVFYPEMAGAADLADRVRAAAAAGADGVNFYNYGLIPPPRLDWIRTAVETAA